MNFTIYYDALFPSLSELENNFIIQFNHSNESNNSHDYILNKILLFCFIMCIWLLICVRISVTFYYLQQICKLKYEINNKNIFYGRIFLFFVIYYNYMSISDIMSLCFTINILESFGLKFIE